ncbi:hypothetical protein J6590_055357 [Homalodisca vitripennis]|nr:hypothetical protein J6590_055357 [Homalodisca vitripennis]
MEARETQAKVVIVFRPNRGCDTAVGNKSHSWSCCSRVIGIKWPHTFVNWLEWPLIKHCTSPQNDPSQGYTTEASDYALSDRAGAMRGLRHQEQRMRGHFLFSTRHIDLKNSASTSSSAATFLFSAAVQERPSNAAVSDYTFQYGIATFIAPNDWGTLFSRSADSKPGYYRTAMAALGCQL